MRLRDGGTVVVEWGGVLGEDVGQGVDGLKGEGMKPLVVIVPGMLSMLNDHYLRSMVDRANREGYEWCIINYRGI